ncbi:hypothetical protein F2Q68_00020752 [Brassica cretica]|uniref:Uncharacterized protein n=1 Tax=Brassica cretica TaxID=69181 RepID=A0A8S9G4U5_BRACR|nr:hypothetical protein F2Q68_00020752 [Brassica cretica]
MEIDLRMLKMPWGCDEEYHVLYNKWLNLKDQNLRWENVAQKQTKLLEEVLEELATVKDKNESLEQEVRKLRKVQQKGLPRFVHGRTSESGAKGACQEVRRDIRQGVRQEVLWVERGRMVIFWYRGCISHGGEKHGVVHISWGRKAHLKVTQENGGKESYVDVTDPCLTDFKFYPQYGGCRELLPRAMPELVNTCKRLILRQSPAAECCLRIRRTPLWCLCSIITPQLAALVNANDVSDAVGVICQ